MTSKPAIGMLLVLVSEKNRLKVRQIKKSLFWYATNYTTMYVTRLVCSRLCFKICLQFMCLFLRRSASSFAFMLTGTASKDP